MVYYTDLSIAKCCMPEPVLLDSDEKRAKLISELEKAIADDCGRGRALIAKEKGPGGRAHELPPKLLAVIEKNIEMREAAYRAMIENLQTVPGNIDTEGFFQRFVMSTTRAWSKDEDYSAAFLNQIRTNDLPPDIRAGVDAATLAKGPGAGAIVMKMPAGSKPEDIQLMVKRLETVNNMANNTFDAFYFAATGEDPKAMRAPSPRYTAFAEEAGRLLFGDTPGSKRGG